MANRQLAGLGIVITGAASGIGEALALTLAQRGARLLLADIDAAGLERVGAAVRTLGAVCFTSVTDTGDEHAVHALAAHAAQTLVDTDILINNAGVSLVSPIEGMQSQDAHWLMDINFWGVVHGSQAFTPQLRSRPDALIVNVSSIFAMVSVPTQSIYNASKAAVRAFSDGLREELHATPVAVLCVHPGGIKTNICNRARMVDVSMVADSPEQLRETFTEMARTTPQQAAAVIIDAMERRKKRVMVGTDAIVMDWMFRWFPTRASHWVSEFGKYLRHRQRALPLKE